MATDDGEAVRAAIAEHGVGSFVVDDLTANDLDDLWWSGSPSHLEAVAEALTRGADRVDYLCVRGPDGAPVAKGGVDYEEHPGVGTLWQLSVHPDLQGVGLGTHLIEALEERVRHRGLTRARIGVEDGNDGALRLYERLGYTPCGRWAESWPAEDEAGNQVLHHGSGPELEKLL